MVIDAESALQAVAVILQSQEVNKTARSSFDSCLLPALGTFVGSLAGGPKGIIPGALAGAVAAYVMKKDTYKSLIEVIQDLSIQEKAALIRNVQQVISSFNIVDVAILMTMASQNGNFQKEILRCVNLVVDSHCSNTGSLNY